MPKPSVYLKSKNWIPTRPDAPPRESFWIDPHSKIEFSFIEAAEPGPHGKPVVAVIGYGHDWAAYEQTYPDQIGPDLIAHHGDKISEEQACDLFPELKNLSYRK